ncbi:protein GOLM2 isoform X2 [Hemiscyllium ocellatum]|uniref:protein GOLM2 isoform X2 n=1 Tax=Hemiscyllium ocellatum TaxID=170820 RepID=UPI002966AEF3|nr:protein GOLM2 isoform X2 [Hemiscyllium ocellatum]
MMFGNSRRGGRLPSLLLLGLLVLMAVLGFNYWLLSSRHGKLQLELLELQVQVKKTDTAKSRLEKRNSELMGQVDTHRRQLDEKEDECSNLGNQLQTKENLMKKCFEEKAKFQNNITDQLSVIHRLQEQLTELRQEFLRQDDQLQEYRNNSTTLQKKLEYESLQCGQQIRALKEQCDEKLKTLGKVHNQPTKHEDSNKQNQSREENEEVNNRQKSDWDYNKAKINLEKQTSESNKLNNINGGNQLQPHRDDGKRLLNPGKADDDAGMPGIEENEHAKPVDLLIDHERNKLLLEEVEKPGSRGGGILGDKLNVDTGMKPIRHFERGPVMQAPPPNQALSFDNELNVGKPGRSFVVNVPSPVEQEEPNDTADENLHVRADEIGESQNHQPVLDRQHQGKPVHHLAKEPAMQPPPNQALHFPAGQAFSNPFDRHGGKGHEKANELGEHPKGRQDEEEQDLQGDVNNPAVYENRHFAADGL